MYLNGVVVVKESLGFALIGFRSGEKQPVKAQQNRESATLTGRDGSLNQCGSILLQSSAETTRLAVLLRNPKF